MAFSREIIKKVLQYVRFRVPQTEEKNSYYTEIGNTLVRVSNHCTWLYRWDEILEKNPKWKGKPIVSIVFEDSGNTFSDKCLVLRRFRMKPIKVMEYIYPLQGNPQFITPQDERLIINGIKQIQGVKYTDLTNKCSEPILRISQNPPDVPPTKTMNNNENKQYNRNMNKKLIRLTESDLHRIVKESVKRVLRESAYPRIRINESFEDGLDEIEWLSQYINDGDVFTAGRTEDGAVLKVKFDYIEMALQDGDADELSIEFSNGYIEENPIGFIKEIRHFMSNGNNFENALRKCIYADSR